MIFCTEFIKHKFFHMGFFNLVWLSFDLFLFSWSPTICFSVALYSCLWICPKISRNAFYLYLFTFLVVILQSTCFVCLTSKRKKIMEQQPHRACKRTKSKQKPHHVTPHSNWPRVLLFDLAHKHCIGVIKGWLHWNMPQ